MELVCRIGNRDMELHFVYIAKRYSIIGYIWDCDVFEPVRWSHTGRIMLQLCEFTTIHMG